MLGERLVVAKLLRTYLPVVSAVVVELPRRGKFDELIGFRCHPPGAGSRRKRKLVPGAGVVHPQNEEN